MSAVRSTVLPVGTRVMVHFPEFSCGYFPGFIIKYLFNSKGLIDRVVILYDKLPGHSTEEYFEHPFPLQNKYVEMTGFSGYESLPAFNMRIEGKHRVFVVHGVGNVEEVGAFDKAPSAKKVEELGNESRCRVAKISEFADFLVKI